MDNKLKVIISGGGTGGHIFPAISIANAIKARRPDADILFVGARGRMEERVVPAAGYEIKLLPITGFDRRNMFRNIVVLYRIWRSQRIARRLLRDFKPSVAVGVGGFASGPMLNECSKAGVPCLIQEQNSYAGVTNKILAGKVDRVCVAYDDMERFFPAEKLLKTGNPVRQNLLETSLTKDEAKSKFCLNPDRRTILIVGGSLGARTLNESVMGNLDLIGRSGAQVIWQTGRNYSASIMHELETKGKPDNLHVTDFISDMGAAYKAADLVISRAGASSISEFCSIGKPVILVPSPNVAEDHQTKNAMALVDKNAALLVRDVDAPSTLMKQAFFTVADEDLLASLSRNIQALAMPNSADVIAAEVLKLADAGRQTK